MEILELINTVTEMKNSIAGLDNRLKLAKERSHKPKNSLIEFIKSEEQRKKNKEK